MALITICFLSLFNCAWKRLPHKQLVISLLLLLSAGAFSGAVLFDKMDEVQKVTYNIKQLTAYCEAAAKGTPPEEVVFAETTHYFSIVGRVTSIALDVAIMKTYPQGIGFSLRGLFWLPLENLSLEKMGSAFGEVKNWTKYVVRSKGQELPPMCEYSVIGAELGIISLIFFITICVYISARVYRYGNRHADACIMHLGYGFTAMLVCFVSTVTTAAFIFFFFAGFLYAISNEEPPSPKI